jgi:hypothetical protein
MPSTRHEGAEIALTVTTGKQGFEVPLVQRRIKGIIDPA